MAQGDKKVEQVETSYIVGRDINRFKPLGKLFDST